MLTKKRIFDIVPVRRSLRGPISVEATVYLRHSFETPIGFETGAAVDVRVTHEWDAINTGSGDFGALY